MCFTLRRAVLQDISSLSELIHESVRQLLLGDYSDQQIEAALLGVFGVDSQLIADGTYFAATPKHGPQIVVGCGGWSRRKTLFGGDGWSAREDRLLEPGRDAARIRAFFVHPQWSRRGIASSILEACELAAPEAGFTRLELGSTLTGIQFYRKHGFIERSRTDVPLGSDLTLRIVHMDKSIALTSVGEDGAVRQA